MEDLIGVEQWAGNEQKLGFFGAVFALAVSMLGTGVLAFPYGFKLCGLAPGIAALVVFAVFAQLSYISLIKCTEKVYVASYGGLVTRIPKAWGHYLNICLSLLLILATAAYVIICADIVQSFASQGGHELPVALQNPVLFAIILITIFPLCLLKSMSGLAGISTYCSGAIILVAGLIVWQAYAISSKDPPTIIGGNATSAKSIVLAVPIYGCAMFGHMNISQIYAELQPRWKPRAHLVGLTAIIGVVAIYVSVGAAGYAAFGQGSLPDVVAQIAKHDGESTLVVLTQSLLGSFIVLKTPFLILPLRNLILSIVSPTVNPAELPMQRHMLLTFVLLACVYVAAISLPDLGKMLDVLGAVCVVPLTFVVPARLSWSIEEPRPTAQILLIGIVGIIASVLSLVAVFG